MLRLPRYCKASGMFATIFCMYEFHAIMRKIVEYFQIRMRWSSYSLLAALAQHFHSSMASWNGALDDDVESSVIACGSMTGP